MSRTAFQSLDRVEQAASRLLGDAGLVIVDIGAAHGLPWHLNALRNVASTICCFEPDPEAAQALTRAAQERGQTNLKVFPVALAGSDAERTLYVTNIPTGSSLLKPGSDFASSFGAPDYFYPMRETTVRTRPLRDVLVESGIPRADTIKIDVQGAEMEVLSGLGTMLAETTLAVELEIGFPGAYIGQPGFGEIDAFMTKAGFLLYDLRLASHHPHFKSDWGYYPREVFGVPADSSTADVNAIRRQIVLLCVYGFLPDALQLIEKAAAANLLDKPAAHDCREAVLAWHGATRDLVTDSPLFDRLARFASQLSARIQAKFFGQRIYRWRG